jgi:GR25 family glycosyltransferase involved in LPS biosynthesis
MELLLLKIKKRIGILDLRDMSIKLLIGVFSLIFANAFGDLERHLRKVTNKSDIHEMRNIDFIYMINLDERPEKLARSLAQLHPYGIYPYRFSAINGWKLPLDTIHDVGVKFEPWMQGGMWGTSFTMRDGQLIAEHEIMHVVGKTYFVHLMRPSIIGIALSHLSILQDAYDSGYQTIWVMEDDIDVIRDPRMIPDLIDKLDAFVGENDWNILFTDIDFRNGEGKYVLCTEYAPRPNFTPKELTKFARREDISSDFRLVGARYGGHSMIIRRSGMKKILDFIKQYSIFHAIDVDYVLPEDIRLYSLTYDVVSQLTDALSDNFAPNYEK